MNDTRISQFRLTTGEAIILASMQSYMMMKDVAAQKQGEDRLEKREQFTRFAKEAASRTMDQGNAISEPYDPLSYVGDGWEQRLANGLHGSPSTDRVLRISKVAPIIAGNVGDRSRGLLLLIELYTFHPWSEGLKWDKKTRNQSLRDLTSKMPPMTEGDLNQVVDRFKKAERRLKLNTINWWKMGAFATGGLALGALTLGLAAPVIGAAVGGLMGLSGAAAVSAGLAALGGGAVAAGGAGMAGGTALLVGAGAIGGGGAAAVTARKMGWTSGQIVVETMKLEVLTDLVIIQEQGQDEVARLVVVGIEERLREVEQNLGKLATQLKNTSRENKDLRKELESQIRESEIAKTQMELTIQELNDELE